MFRFPAPNSVGNRLFYWSVNKLYLYCRHLITYVNKSLFNFATVIVYNAT